MWVHYLRFSGHTFFRRRKWHEANILYLQALRQYRCHDTGCRRSNYVLWWKNARNDTRHNGSFRWEAYPCLRDGITNQRVVIHYNCIGAFDVPDRRKIPEADIIMETRKGVAVSYTPAQIAVWPFLQIKNAEYHQKTFRSFNDTPHGPSGETWTHDPLTPSQVRYQLRYTRIAFLSRSQLSYNSTACYKMQAFFLKKQKFLSHRKSSFLLTNPSRLW